MRFRGDDRAVTVQIGAVILLGFLVVSLSLYQATVVPNENRQIEFQHNQRVQADMLEVRNAILGTAATGSAAPATVELGTRYPTRTVAVNPSPPSGTLSTSELGNISVKNATADDASTSGEDYPETADFWDGDEPRNYTTKALVYRPTYANYQGAPTTVYENGLVYNRFDSGTVNQTEQQVVSGRRISLVAVAGNLSRGGSGSIVVDPQPVSVSTRTISVTNTSGNVSITIPSNRSASVWRGLLQRTDDLDRNRNNSDAYVYNVTPHSSRDDAVVLQFEPDETYQLKLSKIGIGSGVSDTDPAYLTSVEGPPEEPFVNRTYPFVVESRDKYNNPIGTSVVASVPLGDDLRGGTVLESGQYRYQYVPKNLGLREVRASYNGINNGFDGQEPENVEYSVDVQPNSGTGGGGGGGGSAGSIVFDGSIQSTNNGEFRFDIRNDGGSNVEIARFSIGGNLVDRLNAGNDPELRINGGGTNGIANRGGNGNFYNPDGTRYDLDTNAIIQSNNDATVNLHGLSEKTGPGQGQNSYDLITDETLSGLSQTNDQTASKVTITLEFADGSIETFYFA